MKTLALLSLCLTVALGMPAMPAGAAQSPALKEEDRSPLLGDRVPVQGHVEVEDPAPQPKLSSKEQQEKLTAVDMKQSQSTAELEVKGKQEVKTEQEVKEDPEVEVKTEVKEDPEVEVKTEVKEEEQPKEEKEVKAEPEPEVEKLPELKADPDSEVELEVEVDPDIEMEVSLDVGLEVKERQIDMEGTYDLVDEQIMESEPLHVDDMTGNPELAEAEKSMRMAFQNPEAELLPEGEEGAAFFEEGPALDIMGQQMSLSENYFPNEDAKMGMRKLQKEALMVDVPDYSIMEEEGGDAEIRKPRTVDATQLLTQHKQGQSCWPGVVLDGKCYQFFKGPKRASDAEYFCQEHSPGGHLASITSAYNHRELMNMILRQNGALTRTWIGGIRFLETGRFIWLDGSRWSYTDWLSGEPNNTSNLEDCLEVLSFGNGKFNDFTCWEPQAFICSYPH